eukprot:9279137-Pyramimonas_sp.AAC.1
MEEWHQGGSELRLVKMEALVEEEAEEILQHQTDPLKAHRLRFGFVKSSTQTGLSVGFNFRTAWRGTHT